MAEVSKNISRDRFDKIDQSIAELQKVDFDKKKGQTKECLGSTKKLFGVAKNPIRGSRGTTRKTSFNCWSSGKFRILVKGLSMNNMPGITRHKMITNCRDF